MAVYFLTRKALNDLAEIWDHTVKRWSEEQADKYYRLLIEEFISISENPELGKKYSHIQPDLFASIFKRHLIFYRKISPGKIEITRILHQSMDVQFHVKET
ncbi:type II toxin-antitoxin system RelE/ParE family toxin [Salegentibacter sediminis]|uniref:type II toxin-antitoxin system RelE/ParE family toxin n=1 Tax=Salegentibacter sediminis TaxID=1930251 RepID=UPI0009BE736D|nr:type II toxin-antitoxin system RelE/ParE family toxin [Salegentibacter sediminis]